MSRTLEDLWPELGTDERLSIFLERYVEECKERLATAAAIKREGEAYGRLVGYDQAMKDLLFYVVEGRPLPEGE